MEMQIGICRVSIVRIINADLRAKRFWLIKSNKCLVMDLKSVLALVVDTPCAYVLQFSK